MISSRTILFSSVCALLLVTGTLRAQVGDPAMREDEAIERQKILKAADQLDLIVSQNQKLQDDLTKLQQQVQALTDEKSFLQKKIDDLEKNRERDKQSLLKEVAAIVASKPTVAPTTPVPQIKDTPSAKQEGFEYVVEAGDNLWAIAKAYQDAGVKISVDDIRKANRMEKNQDLQAGQKLFIPKK